MASYNIVAILTVIKSVINTNNYLNKSILEVSSTCDVVDVVVNQFIPDVASFDITPKIQYCR